MSHPSPTAPQLIPQLAELSPALIIFDKDGTLIDFHAMWGGWLTELARRFEITTGLDIARQLFEVMGFEAASGHIASSGKLAVAPLAEIRALTVDVLGNAGLSARQAEAAVSAAWHTPDPVALAQPIVNLAALFGALRSIGVNIAIATSDDRTPTQTMLDGLQLTPLVDALACADDGPPIKPAPDMILSICRKLTIPPAKTVMVGDNVPDLQMGRAAGVGLSVGVLSGLSSADILAPVADLLLPDVNGLLHSQI